MRRLQIFIGVCCLVSASAWARDEVLTLDRAIAEVIAANPSISAAHYRTAAAQAQIPQAKSLDDPMVGVMFEMVPIDTANVQRNDSTNYRIEQNIPFPGKRYVRGKAARFDAAAVHANGRAAIDDVLLDVKRSYYDLYRANRLLAVNRENQRLLRQFMESTEAWYATGKTTADTPLKARVEFAELQNEAVLLEQERLTHQSHMKALLNRTYHRDLVLPTQLTFPRLRTGRDDVTMLALHHRPELATLNAMRDRDRTRVTEAKQGLLPDFQFEVQYNQRPNRQDAWTGAAAINLPIVWGKQRGRIREARANLLATEAERASMRTHTHHEIDQAYSAVKAAEQVMASYQRQILPQARATLDAAELAYTARSIDFMTLIDAARTYRNIHMAFYETQAELGLRWAELERLVGQDLLHRSTYDTP